MALECAINLACEETFDKKRSLLAIPSWSGLPVKKPRVVELSGAKIFFRIYLHFVDTYLNI